MEIRPLWRSFKTAAWLGWQIESNWTAPFLFAVYSVVRPLALAGILVVMYAVVTQGNFTSPMFTCIYVGNAFYGYVGTVLSGVAQAVIDDRERYGMLKYMYVAPIDIRLYLAGRGAARFLNGSAAVLITLVFGVLFLGVAIEPMAVDWPLLIVSFTIGIVMLGLMGLLLASVVLVLAHQSGSLGELVAGALYLFSGAIFPLEALPRLLRPIGLAMPQTYWLELVRRAVVGPRATEAFTTFAAMDTGSLLSILVAMTLGLGGVAIVVFRWCDHVARETGAIDRTSNY